MKLYNVVCPNCLSQEVFMTKHLSTSGLLLGIYCDRCLNWIKWANKEERRAYERNKHTD